MHKRNVLLVCGGDITVIVNVITGKQAPRNCDTEGHPCLTDCTVTEGKDYDFCRGFCTVKHTCQNLY